MRPSENQRVFHCGARAGLRRDCDQVAKELLGALGFALKHGRHRQPVQRARLVRIFRQHALKRCHRSLSILCGDLLLPFSEPSLQLRLLGRPGVPGRGGCRAGSEAHLLQTLAFLRQVNPAHEIGEVEAHGGLSLFKFCQFAQKGPQQNVSVCFSFIDRRGEFLRGQPAQSQLRGAHQAFGEEGAKIIFILDSQPRGARGKLQQGPLGRHDARIATRQRVEQEVQQGMADVIEREFAARAHDDGVMIAVVAEIRCAADHRLDVHGEAASESRLEQFAQVRGRGHDQLRDRPLQPGNLTAVRGLHFPPELFDLGLAIEIRQHFAKTFDGQNVRRELIVRQHVVELRRRARHKGKRYVARKRGRRAAQFVFAVIGAQGLGRRPLEPQQLVAEPRAHRMDG